MEDCTQFAHSFMVDPSDPSEVGRVAKKYMRKQVMLVDSELSLLAPAEYFQAAITAETNAIYLIQKRK